MKKFTALLCILLCACIALSACDSTTPQTSTGANSSSSSYAEEPPKPEDPLATELKASLKTYLATEEFEQSLLNAKTTQARIPLLYLRYIDGNFYSDETIASLTNYLDMLDGVTVNGKISDGAFSASDAGKTGWYGIPDFLYSWSAMYNQYAQACVQNATENAYTASIPLVGEYLTRLDAFQRDRLKEYTFKGKTVTQANLYYTGLNAINNIANANSRLTADEFTTLLSLVAQATGNTDGHEAFLTEYAKVDFESIDANTDKSKQYGALKTALLPLWKDCMPVTQCAFGYGIFNVILLTAYNLGLNLDQTAPVSLEFMLSYYDKDENGNYKKNGGTPNWVGFSGRPLSGSVLKSYDKYELAYEKTMQGYFPFTDGWNQPLDEMINMDRLCNYYNHTLGTSASVAPHYGILYGYMNGVDMEHYVKEVSHDKVCPGADICQNHIDETEGQVYNIITLWRENLKKDENGSYIISDTGEMAVAIAYCAFAEGIAAPSPLGLFNADERVISL